MSQDIIPVEPASLPRSQDEIWSWKPTRQLFFLFFKWKWAIFSFGLVFAVATAIVTFRKPLEYRASTKLLFKEDRAPLRIAGLDSKKTSKDSMRRAVRSAVEVLTGWDVAFPVAQELVAREARAGREAKTAEQKAYALIKRTSAVIPPSTTDIIRVTHSANSAEKAVTILGLILQEYMRQHSIVRGGSTKLLSFYEQEKARVGAKLRAAEKQLQQWQEANGIIAIDNQINSLLSALANQKERLQQIETQIAAGLEQDSLTSKLKGELWAEKVALQELLQRYNAKHPHVQKKKEQIAFLRSGFASAKTALVGSLTSQRNILRKQIQETTAALDGFREKKPELAHLSREVELERDSFQTYSKKVEEARISSLLDRAQLSNVAVIENPRAIPNNDQKAQVQAVFLATLVGTGLGIALIFGFEFFRNAIHTKEDIEYYLKLPVLAEISRRHE